MAIDAGGSASVSRPGTGLDWLSATELPTKQTRPDAMPKLVGDASVISATLEQSQGPDAMFSSLHILDHGFAITSDGRDITTASAGPPADSSTMAAGQKRGR